MFVHKTTGEEITFAQLKDCYPLTLFPEGFAADFEDYAAVQQVDQPAHDPATHKVVALPPTEVDGVWLQQWDVVPLTQQEIDDARRARVPQSCTAAQGERALFDLRGITDADVLAAIDQIPDADNRYRARSAYQRATEWRRDSETTQTLAAILSLSEADMDALFTYAVTLRV